MEEEEEQIHTQIILEQEEQPFVENI